MLNIQNEKRRRIDQFAHYLRLMGTRRHKIVKDDCFIIFDTRPPDDGECRRRKSRAKRPRANPAPMHIAIIGLGGESLTCAPSGRRDDLSSPLDERGTMFGPSPLSHDWRNAQHQRGDCPYREPAGAGAGDAPGRTSRADEPQPPLKYFLRGEYYRYYQFCFRRDCCVADLPNNTAFPNEVKQIVRHRGGFFRARNCRDLSWIRATWNDILEWDPLEKIYIYRDEESAAEDMAYVWFNVWNYPVDTRLYVKMASFETNHKWHETIE